MFDEMSKYTKEKERLRAKGYATIQTNYGNLNVELHGDRVSTITLVPNDGSRAEMMFQAPKTVYNWIKLAKQGKYDNVIFHRLIPGFMVCPFRIRNSDHSQRAL
jgi:peptidyl-prolyl cis-trans isomerase-like protein 2